MAEVELTRASAGSTVLLDADDVKPIPGLIALGSVGEDMTCELRDLQAVSRIQGKFDYSVPHDGGWTFPRQVLEAGEGVDEILLPARP